MKSGSSLHGAAPENFEEQNLDQKEKNEQKHKTHQIKLPKFASKHHTSSISRKNPDTMLRFNSDLSVESSD